MLGYTYLAANWPSVVQVIVWGQVITWLNFGQLLIGKHAIQASTSFAEFKIRFRYPFSVCILLYWNALYQVRTVLSFLRPCMLSLQNCHLPQCTSSSHHKSIINYTGTLSVYQIMGLFALEVFCSNYRFEWFTLLMARIHAMLSIPNFIMSLKLFGLGSIEFGNMWKFEKFI